jgi:hypothetical protein
MAAKTLQEIATAQDVFDFVARHLLTQGERSLSIGETPKARCRYRGTGELKCAVGVLIADAHYARGLEDMHVSEPSVVFAIAASLPRAHIPALAGLLSSLQSIHDNAPVLQWRAALVSLATAQGLSPAALAEAS